jgi:hypothetical protein
MHAALIKPRAARRSTGNRGVTPRVRRPRCPRRTPFGRPADARGESIGERRQAGGADPDGRCRVPVDVLHRALDARFSSVIGVARDQIPAGEGRPHGLVVSDGALIVNREDPVASRPRRGPRLMIDINPA